MSSKLVKVKFLLSPTGSYKLAYNAGDIGQVTPELAKTLEDAGYAEVIKEKKSTGTSRKASKTTKAVKDDK